MGYEYPPIEKTGPFPVEPNLIDYASARASFDWRKAWSWLEGLPDGRYNIAHEAVDRHARGDGAEKIAIRWLGRKGERRDLTYRNLSEQTSRFASALRGLGVGRGDRVFLLSHRLPALYM